MRKYKIYGIPSHQGKEHTSGVDFLRIIQPLEQLKRRDDFIIDTLNTKDTQTVFDVASEYDLIYLNYVNNAYGFAAVGAMARHFGIPMVMDIDDDLWNILPDNGAYNIFKPGSEGIHTITCIANEVDAVTCTNLYLKHSLAKHTNKTYDKLQVFENYIDLENQYTYRCKPRNAHNIVIGHFGSTTHFTSLRDKTFLQAMDRIMAEYPNVIFRTIGANIPDYKLRWGMRYDFTFGDVDIYQWIKKAGTLFEDVDFFVTPLDDNVYNRCKSSTKYNEVSSYKRAGVWQDIRQYQERINDGENGFLASTTDGWYKKMKILIDEKERRNTMAEKAFEDVKTHYTIQLHINEYADYLKLIIDNYSQS